jgi:glycosyltransferase involved in cell wall biosynthesis
MTAPSITFAIPFYSGRDYLERAIASVLAQRDPRWLAFVCDNASPEPGIEALVRAAGAGRVGYVRNEHNLGMAGNFNRCIDLAATELVTLLHADDELLPSYAETMIAAAAAHPTAAAVFCRAEIIGDHGEPRFSLADTVKGFISPSQRREVVLAGEPGIRAMLHGNFIVAPTLCFRKRVLGDRRFPAGYHFVLDQELTCAVMFDGDSLVGLPACCYRYRRHGDNATEQLTRTAVRFHEESEFYDRMRDKVAGRGWDRCERIASQKRMLKLNLTYRALRSVAQLQLGDAVRGLKLLREIWT